jgi:hypothetical protein
MSAESGLSDDDARDARSQNIRHVRHPAVTKARPEALNQPRSLPVRPL